MTSPKSYQNTSYFDDVTTVLSEKPANKGGNGDSNWGENLDCNAKAAVR